jgi:transketolase
MALEDLAFMQALPDSIVLYPADAQSTGKLVEHMIEYNQGISYLRTTRAGTPVLYAPHEQFPLGSCKILKKSKKDRACIIAAGITLHEALKAYELLARENIAVTIIDLYCIKPLPTTEIIQAAKEAQNTIVTVEDHYLEGGMGQAICYAVRNQGITVDCLAVTKMPRSGTPEELLAWARIDAQAIVEHIRKLPKL